MADLDAAALPTRADTGETARASTTSPEELVRDYERAHGRRLVDTHLGGWPDLASESHLMALRQWGLRPANVRDIASAGGGGGGGSGIAVGEAARYISIQDGRPQRAIDVHVAADARAGVWMRQRHLLTAAAYGEHYWLYVLVRQGSGALSLKVLHHPTRAEWRPPATTAAPSCSLGDAADAVWHLPAWAIEDLNHLHAAA